MAMEVFQGIELEEVVAYMLANEKIETAMKGYTENPSSETFLSMMTAMIERDAEDGGFILSIHSEEIEPGAENIVVFQNDKHKKLTITNVEIGNESRYALAFTSKRRFMTCNDTSGIVMFIGELVELMAHSDQVDGLILNLENEEIILDKRIIMVLNECMKDKKKRSLAS